MATISEALAIALQHHESGRLQAAEQIYRQILQADPRQAEARHLLGVARGRRVGLVWAGNPDHKGDRLRSMPGESWRPLPGRPGVEFLPSSSVRATSMRPRRESRGSST